MLIAMNDNQKLDARYAVSIHGACSDSPEGHLHIRDMGTRAFLAQGSIKAEIGDVICMTFFVHPSSGPREIHIKGSVVNIQGQGEASLVGIKIESYQDEAEKAAYLEFVAEVAAELEEL